ncbi:MAG: BphX family protein [Candidatus Promineofilum sp.]|nr:BphX family protein [Promineifilum sp.]MBP9657347.1 BphX family protein [Promineifilum sp.]
MKKLTWWFRFVGVWYLLLFLMNTWMMFLGDPETLRSNIPFPADEWVIRAFVDGWSPFFFEMLGIATFAFWASRNSGKHISAAQLIIWLEFMHGIVDDIYLIIRGYSAGGYIAFIVIHLIVIGTGLWAIRKARAEAATLPQGASA